MRISFITIAILALFLLFSCSTLLDKATELATNKVTGNNTSGGTILKDVDFKSGEFLCGNMEDDLVDKTYHLATIVKPASKDTKNQAQVIFVNGGAKEWVDTVLETHKAKKDELQIGRVVVYLNSGRESPADDANEYRMYGWYTARITNTDELFKDIVEIGGYKVHVTKVRIIDSPMID